MHKTLLRQLHKTLGIDDAEQLQQFLAALAVLAEREPAPVPVRTGIAGLGALLERVAATYEQHDRDLALRTRSLELSSEELIAANDKLRTELASREHAIQRLTETADALQNDFGYESKLGTVATLDGLIEVEVRRVRPAAEGVEDQHVQPRQQRRGLVRDQVAIRQYAMSPTR